MTNTAKKFNKTTQRHHIGLLIIIFICVAVASGLIVWLLSGSKITPETSEDTTNPTTASPETTLDDQTPDDSSSQEPADKVTQYEADDPNTLSELTGSIARKSFNDDSLTIVAVINQFLHQSGSCTLNLVSDADEVIYSATTAAIADVTTSVCETFVIPLNQLTPGSYRIIINLTGDDKVGTIVDQVEIN